MVKNILTLSMVASLALFSVGCGGGDSNNGKKEDIENQTTKVKIQITTPSEWHAIENTVKSISLNANEPVDFSLLNATNLFDLNSTTLTFYVPAYDLNSSNEYNVTVKAVDKKDQNDSIEKIITFIVDPIKAKSIVVPVGDKNLTILENGAKIKDLTGLIWLNENTAFTSYAEAKTHCENADNGSGFRIARRDEVLNLIDFTKGDGGTASLLEDEFTENDKSTGWALKVQDQYFSVNFKSGADGVEDDGTTPVEDGLPAEYAALCVKGLSADKHDFKVDENNASLVIDTTTGMKWTKVVLDNPNKRAIVPGEDTENKQPASDYCPDNFRLPTINELRTLVDYSTNTIISPVLPTIGEDYNKSTVLWSDTTYTNGTKELNYYLDIRTTLLHVENVDTAAFVTCVQEANK